MITPGFKLKLRDVKDIKDHYCSIFSADIPPRTGNVIHDTMVDTMENFVNLIYAMDEDVFMDAVDDIDRSNREVKAHSAQSHINILRKVSLN